MHHLEGLAPDGTRRDIGKKVANDVVIEPIPERKMDAKLSEHHDEAACVDEVHGDHEGEWHHDRKQRRLLEGFEQLVDIDEKADENIDSQPDENRQEYAFGCTL